tara:strand:+ start:2288 stop:2578 length:291 start_codon:yes stop_codon:yes gene_type:complete
MSTNELLVRYDLLIRSHSELTKKLQRQREMLRESRFEIVMSSRPIDMYHQLVYDRFLELNTLEKSLSDRQELMRLELFKMMLPLPNDLILKVLDLL